MEKLSLSTLPQYDQGSVAVLFDQAIRDAYLDLEDRPLLKKDRVVTLVVKLKPHEVDEAADLEEVASEIHVKCALPDKQARVNILAPSKKLGGLGFEPDTRRAKFAPDQQTLPISDGEDEE